MVSVLMMLALPVHISAVAPVPSADNVLTTEGPLRTITADQVMEAQLWQDRGWQVVDAHPSDASAPDGTLRRYCWVVDSGCTAHMTFDPRDLSQRDSMVPKIKVRVANGSLEQPSCSGSADLVVKQRQSGYVKTMRLSNVLVVPTLAWKLFSVKSAFNIDGIRSYFNEWPHLTLPAGHTVPFLQHASKYLVVALPMQGWRKRADANAAASVSASSSDVTTDLHDDDLIHARLGHFGLARVRSAEGRSDGVPHLGRHDHDPTQCEACLRGGARAMPFQRRKTPRIQFKSFGDRVSSDLCGPFPASKPHDFTYAIVFYDWATSYIKTYYLKSKEGEAVLAAFKQFLSDHKDMLPDERVKEWHTDNGNEFTSRVLDDFCAEFAVRRSYSIPYAPPSNAYAERAWGTLLRPMRIMAAAAGHKGDTPFWPFLMNQAVQIHNSLPTRRFDPPLSPHEKLHRRKPDISKFRVMLSKCYVRLNDIDRRHKLSATAADATYLGYDERRRGHFVYVPELKRITTAYHVKFAERKFLPVPAEMMVMHYHDDADLPSPANAFQQPQQQPQSPQPQPLPQQQQPPLPQRMPPVPHAQPPHLDALARHMQQRHNAAATSTVSAVGCAVMLCSGLIHCAFSSSPSTPLDVFSATTDAGTVPIPRNYAEAMAGPWHEEWQQACVDDLEGKGKNGWMELVDVSSVPPGTNVMKGKWAFAVKYNDDHSVNKFRARWVGCGYSEIYGRDYDETSIGTLNATTCRVLFAIAADKRRTVYNIDISKAFTTADMDRDLYCQQPVGFEVEGKVCRLIKALEGTKQAGHLFYKKCADALKSLGAERCEYDPCLYKIKYDDGEWVMIGIFVDDLLLIPSSDAALARFKDAFGSKFEITGGEPCAKFLGLKVEQDDSDGSITLSQSHYIEQLHKKFVPGGSRERNSPVDTGADGAKKFMNMTGAETDADKAAMHGKDYLGLVGALLFVTNMTRPDCSFYVSYLGQFMAKPSVECYDAALVVLSYLYKTRHLGITFGGELKTPNVKADPPFDRTQHALDHGVHTWSDASWGNKKSHGGHIVMGFNGPLCWSSRRLRAIAQSSTEAEIGAGVGASKDIIFVRNILAFLGYKTSPTPLLIDNLGMWHQVKNVITSKTSRHFALWQQFVRWAFQSRRLNIHLIPTTEERADIFTKALPHNNSSFVRIRDEIMNNA